MTQAMPIKLTAPAGRTLRDLPVLQRLGMLAVIRSMIWWLPVTGAAPCIIIEAEEPGSCLEFRRAALWDNAASMSADVQLYDIDNDGRLEVVATVYDTSFAKNSSSGSVFIWKRMCQADSECDDGLFCNGAETCVEGACAEGSLPCGEGEYCNEGAGLCWDCLSDEDCLRGLSV